MSWQDQIVTCIQQAAGTFNRDIVSLVLCNVDSINEDGFSCACTAISGNADTQIPSVKLNAEANDGFVITPKVGSTVMVACSTRNNYYVFMYSDIDKIDCVIDDNNSYSFSSAGFIWNNGTLGGMAKTADIATKLNNLENNVNELRTAINGWTPVPNDGGAALKVAVATWLTHNLSLTTASQIEDTKIKH